MIITINFATHQMRLLMLKRHCTYDYCILYTRSKMLIHHFCICHVDDQFKERRKFTLYNILRFGWRQHRILRVKSMSGREVHCNAINCNYRPISLICLHFSPHASPITVVQNHFFRSRDIALNSECCVEHNFGGTNFEPGEITSAVSSLELFE